ncbi:MAG: DUF2484 family protein [Gemmobacter sp.]
MTPSLIAAALWVFAATATAFLPMRRQMVPGVILLALAPVLIVWIGVAQGWIWAGISLLAFLSMFRNPLIYFWKRSTGRPVALPPELQRGPE